MNRSSWNIQRRRARDSYPSREDRGLPRHPNGSGLAACPRCTGNGVIDSYHYAPDLCTFATCSCCAGSGYVDDGYRDPLLDLRYARQHRHRNPAGYAWLRQVAMTPREVA